MKKEFQFVKMRFFMFGVSLLLILGGIISDLTRCSNVMTGSALLITTRAPYCSSDSVLTRNSFPCRSMERTRSLLQS